MSETARWKASGGLYPRPEHADRFEAWNLSFPTVDASVPACREVWAAVRDEIISAWAVARPGRRPEYWWVFDAPEPRRETGDPPRLESEAAYLARLDLLEPGEKRRLQASDFEPEPVEVEDEQEGD